MDTPAPAALCDLIAAGLVSHEMIGDPEKLAGEAGCLRTLCTLIDGPVYRIEAYHYAFRAGPDDLNGELAALAPGEWTQAIETALCASLGEDAVWLNATDLLPETDAALAQPLLLLRVQEAAISSALESAGPDIQAVVNARYAAECARLTLDQVASDGAGQGMADRLAALEARQVQIADTLARVLERLDIQSERLSGRIEDLISVSADRTAEDRAAQNKAAQDIAAAAEAFKKTLGLTFAEFLARMEQHSEEERTAIRVSRYS